VTEAQKITTIGLTEEGFGGWWELIMSSRDAKDTAKVPLACIMDRNGSVHHDGQIWSRALFDVYKAFGRDKDAATVQAAFTARGIA
jgi:hypothetical protein